MNPPSETRRQVFERLRKEYRSQMSEEDAIAIFDNSPDWLPDHLKAQLPPEESETIPALQPAADSVVPPFHDLINFLAYLSLSSDGFAAALYNVYAPNAKQQPGTQNRHRMARILILSAQLEQVLQAHKLPTDLLSQLIQSGYASPHTTHIATTVNLKEEIKNEPFAVILAVLTAAHFESNVIDRVIPVIDEATAPQLASYNGIYKTYFLQKFRETGHLYEPGSPAKDTAFDEPEKQSGFALNADELSAYTSSKVQAAACAVPPGFTAQLRGEHLITLRKRISSFCPAPVQSNQQTTPEKTAEKNVVQPTIEERLYPEGKPPAEPKTEHKTTPKTEPAAEKTAYTTENLNGHAQTKQEEKPDFWKRVWNWLGTNWDKLLLGILIVGGFLWLIWKQYFSGDKKKHYESEQDEPAARKKRSGYSGESFSVS